MAQEHGKRIWAGDLTTVAEARAKYEADHVGQLIPFAVALYSFRTERKFANELIFELHDPLVKYAKRFVSGSREKDIGRSNTADVLSTHLEWMSRQPSLLLSERNRLHELAREVCGYGLNI